MKTFSNKLSSDSNTISTSANCLHVHGILSALMIGSSNLLIVNFVTKSVDNLVQHLLCDIFRHNNSFVRIFDEFGVHVSVVCLWSFIDLVIITIIVGVFFSKPMVTLSSTFRLSLPRTVLYPQDSVIILKTFAVFLESQFSPSSFYFIRLQVRS